MVGQQRKCISTQNYRRGCHPLCPPHLLHLLHGNLPPPSSFPCLQYCPTTLSPTYMYICTIYVCAYICICICNSALCNSALCQEAAPSPDVQLLAPCAPPLPYWLCGRRDSFLYDDKTFSKRETSFQVEQFRDKINDIT